MSFAALALVLVACRGKAAARGEGEIPLGRRLVATDARTVIPSSDGEWLAYLDRCAEVRGQFLPQRTANCDLWVVSANGGEPQKVASAVTTEKEGVLWHPKSPLLSALGDYDYATASGSVYLWSPSSGSQKVADGVTFYGFAPGEESLVALSHGRFLEKRVASEPEWLTGLEGLTSLEMNPGLPSRSLGRGAAALLLRKPNSGSLGGLLFARTVDGKIEKVAARAGDYAFAPGGGAFAFTEAGKSGYDLYLVSFPRPPRLLGHAVRTFTFSPDGGFLALVADAAPGKEGDLFLAAVAGGEQRLASDVGDVLWASRASPPRLAWLSAYDPRVRSGTAGAGGPGERPRSFSKHVTDLSISPDGAFLAYLEHTFRGGYSVDLYLAKLDGDSPPRAVATGAFGFAFSPDSNYLYARTRCGRNGDACDLVRTRVDAPVGTTVEVVAAGVKSFEFDERDPERLLLGWQRMDRVALDVGIWERGKLTRVDGLVEPGSASLIGPKRLAYAVIDPKRRGVYVAEVPPTR